MATQNKKPLSFFHPAKFVGTWFGVGLFPIMPGTMGSIAALPFAYFIQIYWGNNALLIASIIAFFIGWAACNAYLPHTNSFDPREMVIDEVAAQWLLLSFLYPTPNSYIVGLVLFRLFDIIKPWPICTADQKIHGGFGVMFDDTLAALYPIAIALCIIFLARYTDRPLDTHIIINFLAKAHVC